MKRLTFIVAVGLLLSIANADAKKPKKAKLPAVNPIDLTIRQEIAQTPEKSGYYYYAYPYTTDSLAPVPAGFKPIYISHYGRHGSRWNSSESLPAKLYSIFKKQNQAGNLTEEGVEMMGMLRAAREHAKGHGGELSPLGNAQHKAIAARMYARFPEMFPAGDTIIARSTTVPRCIISMSSFCESLKENNPKLVIKRYASPGDMKILAFHSKEAKAIYDDEQEWKNDFNKKRDSLDMAQKTLSRLFKDPSKIKDRPKTVRDLQEIAVTTQNINGLDVDMLKFFDSEDLYNIWKGEDYKNYVRHGNSIEGKRAGAKSAKSLLKDILDLADESLAGKRTSVDLRFGHDIYLLRLYALMDIEGANASVKGIDEASRVWQSYRITPMAANLQLVIFSNPAGEKIATIRINERPAKVAGLKEFAPGYYKWSELEAKWREALNS